MLAAETWLRASFPETSLARASAGLHVPTMATATWNGAVIAESDDVEIVENNVYFPASAVNQEYLRPSENHTVCGWKGTASYYSLEVEGKLNRDAAWFYPEPKDEAKQITGRVAFWKGVTVTR